MAEFIEKEFEDKLSQIHKELGILGIKIFFLSVILLGLF